MDEIGELLSRDAGARFRAVDLHVHTPASGDMGSSAAEQWNAADVVRLALEQNLDAIAVTDHNSAAWCDDIRLAAEGTELTVFPGVEVSTSEGHVLAIFDPTTAASAVDEFLVKVGIGSKQRGDLKAIASCNMTKVADLIEEAGGVAIAAHVDREKGFWSQMLRVPARRMEIYAAPSIRAFELVDTAQRSAFLTGSISGYPRTVACVQGSDCYVPGSSEHELHAVGMRRSYLSMGEMSVAGLRHALLDPDIAVRLTEDEIPKPPALIEGMWVSGGFFDRQMIRLNPNITCLIGGTGSGKSLSLELLRFALNQQVEASVLKRIAEDVHRLLSFALGELAAVSVLVSKGGERYLIQRSWLASPPGPTVQRLTDDGIRPIADPVDVPTFFPIRAFSQGEIIEYAREPLARLSLLDDLIDLDDELHTIEATKAELRRNAAELLEAESGLTAARERIKELPGILEDVARYDRLVTHPAVKAQDAWYAEQRALDAAAQALVDLREDVDEAYPVTEQLLDITQFEDSTPSLELMKSVAAIGTNLETAVAASRAAVDAATETAVSGLQEIRRIWNQRFAAANEAYQEVVANLDLATRSQAGLHVKLSALRAKEEQLQATAESIRTKLEPRLKVLREQRESLLNDLQAARKSIRGKRAAKAKDLSDRLERRVLIKVHGAGHTAPFVAELLDLRTGSQVREPDLRTIAAEIHPVRFVKLLLAEEFAELSRLSRVPEDVFSRFAENITAKKRVHDLYEAQLIDVEDEVRVQFALEGQTYRDLADLAHGQKCTVVLMIALAEGDFPLLVDQPEDALHAPWIEEYIVSSLRGRRGTRQCIFATRSANVIVSADAEQIVALRADAIHGAVDRTGALDGFGTRDLVLYHVEGGETAFARRQAKYEASRRPAG